MDKRRKHIDPETERKLREQLYKDIDAGRLSIANAVRKMRRVSRLTQAEFAKHRGVSLLTLKHIEAGRANSKVETLNQIGKIFGLELTFVRSSRITRSGNKSTPSSDA